MFSASWRMRSSSSLLLFLFAIFLEAFSHRVYVDEQIGQCSEDIEHLVAVDDLLDLAAALHRCIVSV